MFDLLQHTITLGNTARIRIFELMDNTALGQFYLMDEIHPLVGNSNDSANLLMW